jgi:hypothetical protein
MQHEPRVFLPQVVEKFNQSRERFEPVFDLSTATVFGSLTPILNPTDNPIYLARLTARIRDGLKDFDADRDFFLAIGDPSMIAVCAGLILRRQSCFKMLKWDKKMSRYIVMEISV